MRILWFVSYLENRQSVLFSSVPSVRLRCLLPAHELAAKHPDWLIHVINLEQIQELDFSELDSADVAVFGKVFAEHDSLYRYLIQCNIPIVMDLCENIYQFAHLSESYRLLSRFHSKTVASCIALKELYQQHSGQAVTVIGDCVEGQRFPPKLERLSTKTEIQCLWYGIPHNLNFLIHDLPNFEKLKHIKIHIKILTQIDDEVEQWFAVAKDQYSPAISLEVLQWDIDLQFAALQQCDVVLVPSAKDQIFRVKTANRVITALWAGKPCIAYPLPSYQEFQPFIALNKSLADGFLEFLATPRVQVSEKIRAAQEYIAEQYSLEIISQGWESVLCEAVANGPTLSGHEQVISEGGLSADETTSSVSANDNVRDRVGVDDQSSESLLSGPLSAKSVARESIASTEPESSAPNPDHSIGNKVLENPQELNPQVPGAEGYVALNLGCGDKIIPGYINVDVVDERAGNRPDVICDVRKLEVFEDNYADEILTVHVIEHFYQWEAEDVLLEWLRVLKPGGKMVVECPNLLIACEEILKNPQQATGPGPEGQRTMWALYGDPAWQDPLMCHKWLYTPDSLGQLLIQCGLENIAVEVAQYKLGSLRDMRLVGFKPALAVKELEINQGDVNEVDELNGFIQHASKSNSNRRSLIDLIGAVGGQG